MAPPLLLLQNIALSFGGTTAPRRGRTFRVAGRAALPRRPQRLGQVDAPQDRRRRDRSRQRQPVPPALGHRPLPSANAGSRRASPRTLDFVEAGLGPGDDPHRARYLLETLGLTGAEDPIAPLRRGGAAGGARPRAGAGTRHSPPRRADQSSRRRGDRGARIGARSDALGDRHDQPRPALPREPVERHGVARSRRDAPARSRLRRFRGLARRRSRGRGTGAAQARSQDRQRGALAALRGERAAEAQPEAARQSPCPACRAPRRARQPSAGRCQSRDARTRSSPASWSSRR